MKHSSIENMTLNIAPVMVEITKEYLTDEQDIWTIKMVKYDYQAIRSKIDAQMEIIFDKETGEIFTTKAWFKMKEIQEFKKMLEKETEFNTACDIAKQYIKASYIENE